MNYIIAGQTFYDWFAVVDPQTGSRVAGLTEGDFTIRLFNPDGTTNPVSVHFDPKTDGLYRVGFSPDEEGTWIINVDHSSYFPGGKSESYQAVGSTFFYDAATVAAIKERTDNLPDNPVDVTDLATLATGASLSAVQGDVTDIKTATDRLPANPAGVTDVVVYIGQ